MTPAYPTPEHARAAERVVEFFAGQPGVEAVLLTCSCARGKATTRRAYPIAYDKLIHEPVAEILGLPELYVQLAPLFEIGRPESHELSGKARALEGLLEEYAPAGGAEA